MALLGARNLAAGAGISRALNAIMRQFSGLDTEADELEALLAWYADELAGQAPPPPPPPPTVEQQRMQRDRRAAQRRAGDADLNPDPDPILTPAHAGKAGPTCPAGCVRAARAAPAHAAGARGTLRGAGQRGEKRRPQRLRALRRRRASTQHPWVPSVARRGAA